MKISTKLSALAAAFLLTAGLTGCTNDLKNSLNPSNPDLSKLNPVIEPDAIVYSGNQTFSNSITGLTSTATKATTERSEEFDDIISYYPYSRNDFVEVYMNNQLPNTLTQYLYNYYFNYNYYDTFNQSNYESFWGHHVPEIETEKNLHYMYYAKDADLIFPISLFIIDYNWSIIDEYLNEEHQPLYEYLGIFYYDSKGNKHERIILDNIDMQRLRQIGSNWYGWYEYINNDNPINSVYVKVKQGYKFGFFVGGRSYEEDYDESTGITTRKWLKNYYTRSKLNYESDYPFISNRRHPEYDGVAALDLTFSANDYWNGKPICTGAKFLCFELESSFPDYNNIIFLLDDDLPKVGVDDILPVLPPSNDDDLSGKNPNPDDPNNPDGKDQEVQPKPDPNNPDNPQGGDKDGDDDDDDEDNPGGDNGDDDKDDDNGSTVKPGVKPSTEEVEVNLSLLDVHTDFNKNPKYDIADLVTKLSIHVRYPHDVEVIIPVPEKFYCDQDDLYILKDHYADSEGKPNWVYGGTKKTYENFIDGHDVTLTVEYVSANDDELTGLRQGYIRVYTTGIDDEVINYCREEFGDGINFEVYNYYNRGTMYTTGYYDTIDYFDLQYNYLSHSLVNFDWDEPFGSKVYPDFYINAFNQLPTGEPNWGDCYVWIFGDDRAKIGTELYKNITTIPDERSEFWQGYQDEHYNVGPFNWIYTCKKVKGSVDPAENSYYTVMPGSPFPFTTSQSPYQDILVNKEVRHAK